MNSSIVHIVVFVMMLYNQNCSWGDACLSAGPLGENPAVGPPLTVMDAALVGTPFPSQTAMDATAWERSPPVVYRSTHVKTCTQPYHTPYVLHLSCQRGIYRFLGWWQAWWWGQRQGRGGETWVHGGCLLDGGSLSL